MAINKNVLAEKQATVLSEDGNTMYATIQMRHGKESEMDKSKFVPAEMGVATDTRKVFIAFAPNNVEEMALKKDIPDGTADYTDLENKPSIGGVTVEGNKTLEDYNIQPKGDYLTEVPDGYVKDEDLQLSLAKKLDKNQGTENAGKTLVVGKDGNVIHGGNLESLAIKLTASGDSPLSIRDSSEWKVQNFAMQGKTEQMQTTGAQLFDEIFEIGGIDSETGENTNGSNSAVIRSANYIPITPGEEPYTGGQPSPSPDYPQEIVNSGNWNEESQKWEYEVSIKGKNLAKVVNFSGATIAGVKVIVDKNGRYKLSGVATGNSVYVLNQPSGSDFGNFPIIFTLKAGHKYRIMDTQLFTRRNDGTTATIGITEPSDMGGNGIIYEPIQDLSVIGIRIYIKNGATYNDSTLYTPGAWEDPSGTDTIWEPYRTPQILTLQSNRPLTKWDRLEKRDGQWGWVYNSNNIVFDGSEDENWMKHSNNIFYIAISDKIGSGLNGEKNYLCNKLTPFNTNIEVINMPNNTIKESGILGQKNMYLHIDEAGNDVESFKTWLQSNSLLIWYKTAEETFVPLTESEQSALESLTTYFPTTIITVEAGELAPEIEVEYVADTKTYIDNKFAELAQNLAATQNTLLEV